MVYGCFVRVKLFITRPKAEAISLSWLTILLLCPMSRYAFGDCRTPSSESSAIIEEVIHRQMTELVSEGVQPHPQAFPVWTRVASYLNSCPDGGSLGTRLERVQDT